jgi:predicted nucleotidyltransferase
MSRNLLNLSGKTEPLIIEILEVITNVADTLSIRFFVVGATARDIILKHGYNIQTTRATMDIDLGVQVTNWGQYEKLKQEFLDTNVFKQEKQEQRLKYKNTFIIDIIPFGGISEPEHRFNWPSEDGVEMNTLGFIESYDAALIVRLRENPVLDVKFAGLPGLVIMKIIAWHDNPARGRDAKDLKLIIHHYLEAGNTDRIFDEERDIFSKINKNKGDDFKRAGARLLGRDINKIATPESKQKILEILNKETGERDRYKLVEAMADTYYESGNDFEENIELLEQVISGMLDE